YVTEIGNAIRAEVDPEALPDEPINDLLKSYALLALGLGETVTAADVHDAWVGWMAREPDHSALIPFDRLEGRKQSSSFTRSWWPAQKLSSAAAKALTRSFLTMNGVLLTAVGLFPWSGTHGHVRLQAAAIVVVTVAGAP